MSKGNENNFRFVFLFREYCTVAHRENNNLKKNAIKKWILRMARRELDKLKYVCRPHYYLTLRGGKQWQQQQKQHGAIEKSKEKSTCLLMCVFLIWLCSVAVVQRQATKKKKNQIKKIEKPTRKTNKNQTKIE